MGFMVLTLAGLSPTPATSNILNPTRLKSSNVPLKAFQKMYVSSMTSLTTRKRGRPSKGARHVVTARMDAVEAEKLFKVAEARGLSVSELIASHMTAYLASVDLDALVSQEALPIAQAS